MEDVRALVARNLTQCRKAAGLTQLQVAEKLNYSDKAISKWERGEGLPDLLVLCELARLYGVTLDYFVHEHARPPRPGGGKRRILVCAMSVLLVWLVAVCCFAVLFLLDTEGPLWLAFAYGRGVGTHLDARSRALAHPSARERVDRLSCRGAARGARGVLVPASHAKKQRAIKGARLQRPRIYGIIFKIRSRFFFPRIY